MFNEKFASWLKRLANESMWPAGVKPPANQAELAGRLGIDQGTISNWLIATKVSVKSETLERICVRKVNASAEIAMPQVLEEILGDPKSLKAPSNVAFLEERYVDLWQRLGGVSPEYRERVLKTLEDLEELKLLDIVVTALRIVVAEGARGASLQVAKLLQDHAEARSAALTRRRNRLVAEYDRIGR